MRFSEAAALAIFAAAPLASAEDATDRETFGRVCGACHAATMVSDLKTEPEWVETVDQMIEVGAKGTREDFERVLRYLARNFTRVNVNTASAAQIAPVLDVIDAVAQAVVDYRSRHGKYERLDDLKKIPGLNAARLEERKDRIAFR